MADIFYAIGATHQICQDYAMANGDYAVISDGCSSAKESDWGARLLTKAFETIIKQTEAPLQITEALLDRILTLAWNHSISLNLNEDCLAATLGSVYKTKDGINAFMYGDGYIIGKARDGKHYKVIENYFETNAPYYLYYRLRPENHKSYTEHFGKGRFYIRTTFYEDNKIVDTDESNLSALDARNLTTHFFHKDDYEFVGVSSDGLGTFVQLNKGNTSITYNPVKVIELIKGLFDFKNSTGQFVHRRCQKLLLEHRLKEIRHNDDFSIGVIAQ